MPFLPGFVRVRSVASILSLTALCLSGLTGCGISSFWQQGDAPGSTDQDASPPLSVATADGVASAKFDSGQRSVDSTLTADPASAVASASIFLPAGTLAVDTEASIQEGVSLASSDFASSVGLADDNSMTAAGPAVVVETNPAINPAQPFVLALPIAGAAGLGLTGSSYAVIYVSFDAETNLFYRGIIAQSDIELSLNIIRVKARFFGSYQVVTTTSPVTVTPPPVVTGNSIIKKNAERDIPKIKWDNFGFSVASRTRAVKVIGEAPPAEYSCMVFRGPSKDGTGRQGTAVTADAMARYSPVVKTAAAVKFFLRFECQLASGYVSASPVLGPIEVGAIEVKLGGMPADNEVSRDITFTPVFDGFGVYEVSWAHKAGAAACGKDDFSAWKPALSPAAEIQPALGLNKLCVRARDQAGNEAPVFVRSWTQQPADTGTGSDGGGSGGDTLDGGDVEDGGDINGDGGGFGAGEADQADGFLMGGESGADSSIGFRLASDPGNSGFSIFGERILDGDATARIYVNLRKPGTNAEPNGLSGSTVAITTAPSEEVKGFDVGIKSDGNAFAVALTTPTTDYTFNVIGAVETAGTWASSVIYSGSRIIIHTGPKMAVSPSGTVIAVWTAGSILYSSKVVGGAWATPVAIYDAGAGNNLRAADLAAGAGDVFAATWIQASSPEQTAGTGHVFATKYEGGSWIMPAAQVSASTPSNGTPMAYDLNKGPQVAVSASGLGMVAWRESTGLLSRIIGATFPDHNAIFTSPAQLSSSGVPFVGAFRLAVAGQGAAKLVWEDRPNGLAGEAKIMARDFDAAGLSTQIVMSASPDIHLSSFAPRGIDGLVAWTQGSGPSETAYTSTYSASSDSFTTSMPVPAAHAAHRGMMMPQASFSVDGRGVFVWLEQSDVTNSPYVWARSYGAP